MMIYNVVYTSAAAAALAEIETGLAADILDFVRIIRENPQQTGIPTPVFHRPRGRMLSFKTIVGGDFGTVSLSLLFAREMSC